MYAIQLTHLKWFIGNDGLLNSSKSAAKIFPTVLACHEYVKDWRINSKIRGKEDIELDVVEIETKLVVRKVKNVVEAL